MELRRNLWSETAITILAAQRGIRPQPLHITLLPAHATGIGNEPGRKVMIFVGRSAVASAGRRVALWCYSPVSELQSPCVAAQPTSAAEESADRAAGSERPDGVPSQRGALSAFLVDKSRRIRRGRSSPGLHSDGIYLTVGREPRRKNPRATRHEIAKRTKSP